MRLALAQINSVIGDLDFNIKKILEATRECMKQHASLLITPELSLTGYPPEDLMFRKEFLSEVEHKLQNLAQLVGLEFPDLTVVIGHPCFKAQEGLVYNSASVIRRGSFLGQYSKLELPNYAVFDERRYFASDGGPLVFKCGNISFGINIFSGFDLGKISEFVSDKTAEQHKVTNKKTRLIYFLSIKFID